MRNVSFSFQRFDVSDANCGHKVGTDGVVIGAWADCMGAKRILDIGAGSGLISLMMAQRSDARITAVEIDRGAAEDARDNIAVSPWCDRVEIVNSDFKRYVPTEPFDLIVSNPPFFTESLQSPDQKRAKARHEGLLNYRSLIEYASVHLTRGGKLSFIYSSGLGNDIIYCAEMLHLKLRRHCLLRQKADGDVIRELYEFSTLDGEIAFEDLAIRTDSGEYTTAFNALTEHFYL